MNKVCCHERLKRSLAGSLNADDEAMLFRHLDECEPCAAELERMTKWRSIRSAASVAVSCSSRSWRFPSSASSFWRAIRSTRWQAANAAANPASHCAALLVLVSARSRASAVWRRANATSDLSFACRRDLSCAIQPRMAAIAMEAVSRSVPKRAAIVRARLCRRTNFCAP